MSWTVGGDNHVVFAAQPKFAGDVDAGLVGKRHAGFENGFAAAHEVGMLVAVEADAVAEPMREEFVIGAIAGAGDDRTTETGTKKRKRFGREPSGSEK